MERGAEALAPRVSDRGVVEWGVAVDDGDRGAWKLLPLPPLPCNRCCSKALGCGSRTKSTSIRLCSSKGRTLSDIHGHCGMTNQSMQI